MSNPTPDTSRLKRWLQRHGYRLGFVLGLLMVLPSIFTGFLADDYVHIATIEKRIIIASPFDLFKFAEGTVESNSRWINTGPFLWYTDPEIALHFFRPLSSATMVLDHALFGRWAAPMHAHSILWCAALLAAGALIFRRILPGMVGALAFLLFAVDEAHAIPTFWWSNRNALVAAVPAILGLAAHLRWRQEGWKPGLPLSLAGYATGLAGGEGALGIMGYVIAYELLGAQDSRLRRFGALVPAGLLSVLYLIFYKRSGFGVSGSGVYFDPVGEAPLFFRHVPERLMMMLGQHLFALPVELPVFFAPTALPLLLASSAVVALVVFATWRLWPRFSPEEQRALRWMSLGAAIALFPVLATFPSSRVLTLPSLGGAVVLALLLRHGAAAAGRLVPITARALLCVHLVLVPAAVALGAIPVWMISQVGHRIFDHVITDDEDMTARRIVLIASFDPLSGFYPYVMRTYRGDSLPTGWNTLSMAPHDHRVTRTGPRSFEVEVLGGQLLEVPFERLIRSEGNPIHPGDRFVLDEFTIEVLECGDWGPTRFRFEGAYDLDDTRYCFLAWDNHELREFHWRTQPAAFTLSRGEGYFQQYID